MSIHRGLATSKNREMPGDIEPVIPQRGEKRKSPEETLESRVARNTLCDSHNTISGKGVGCGSKTIDPHSPITKKSTIEFHRWQNGGIHENDSEKNLCQTCEKLNLLYHSNRDLSDEIIKNILSYELLLVHKLVQQVFKKPSIFSQLEKQLDPLVCSTLISSICDQASQNEKEFINVLKYNPQLFKEISNDAWQEISKETKALIQEIFAQRLVDDPKDIQHVVKLDTIDLRNINNWWTSVRCHIRAWLRQLEFPSMEEMQNCGQTPDGMLLSVCNDIMKDEEAFTKALQQVTKCASDQEATIAAIDLNNFDSLTDEQQDLLRDPFNPRCVLENNPKVFAKVNNLNMSDSSFPFYYLAATSIAKYVEKNPEKSAFKDLQERLKPSQDSDQLRNAIYDVIMEPFLDPISPEFFGMEDRYVDYKLHHVLNQEVLRPILQAVLKKNPLLLNDFIRAFVNDYEGLLAASRQASDVFRLIDQPLTALQILEKLVKQNSGKGVTGEVIILNYAFLSDKVKKDTAFWKHILHVFPESLDLFIPYLPPEIRQGREKSWELLVKTLRARVEAEERQRQLEENNETRVQIDDWVAG